MWFFQKFRICTQNAKCCSNIGSIDNSCISSVDSTNTYVYDGGVIQSSADTDINNNISSEEKDYIDIFNKKEINDTPKPINNELLFQYNGTMGKVKFGEGKNVMTINNSEGEVILEFNGQGKLEWDENGIRMISDD